MKWWDDSPSELWIEWIFSGVALLSRNVTQRVSSTPGATLTGPHVSR